MDTAAVGGVLAPFLLDLGPQLGLSPLPIALSLAIWYGRGFHPLSGRAIYCRVQLSLRPNGPIRTRDVADFSDNTHRTASTDPIILADDWIYLR